MKQRIQRVETILQELVHGDSVHGAALISRDGLCVKASGKAELNRETFSAMTATLMGAAEIALGELGGGRTRSVVATTERGTMILVGATSDLLLVAYAASADGAVPRVLQAAEAVQRALAEE